jgi:hypothetical protein
MKLNILFVTAAILSRQLTSDAFSPSIHQPTTTMNLTSKQAISRFTLHLSPDQASKLEQAANEKSSQDQLKEDTLSQPPQSSTPLSASSSIGKDKKTWWSSAFKKFISRRG